MKQMNVAIHGDTAGARRAIAQLREATRVAVRSMGESMSGASKALRGFASLFEAISEPPSAEDRAWARRANRAARRSLRNQPRGSGRSSRPHGRPR